MKGKATPPKFEPPPDAADDHVGILAGQLHLLERFLPDHGLVQQHVVQDAPERVLGVFVLDRVLDRLAYGYAERSRRVGMLLQDVAAGLREVRRARVNLGPVGLHHDAPVGLLVVADADHVDRAIEVHHAAGEGQGGAPLARSGLRGQAPDALLAVVVRLGDGGVRLVAAGRADALVLVVDVGRGVEELFQAAGAEERGRAPEAVDLTHLFGDGNIGLRRHFLLDNRLREDRGESLGPHRLHRGRIQRRLQLEGQIGHQVVPALGDGLLVEEEFRCSTVLALSRCLQLGYQLTAFGVRGSPYETPGTAQKNVVAPLGARKVQGKPSGAIPAW